MDGSVPPAAEGYPPQRSERVDDACDAFEAAWRAGHAPRIEDYLAAAGVADKAALIAELVALEQELRRGRGDRPRVEEYLERFPENAGAIRAAFAKTPAERGAAPARRPEPDTGRNLLFGILPLQNNFVSRDDLLGAFVVWVADKTRSLAQILVDRRALDAARRTLLEALVAEHLKQHGDDPEASLVRLGRISSLDSLRNDLDLLGDRDLQASVAIVARNAAAPGSDAHATVTFAHPPRRAGDRFRILRFHREGGLGRVYVAQDEELGREVALKEIRPDKDADDFRGRFVLEAEINGGLEHPGIVPVYSLGTYADGRPFYAMRFVEGDSMREAIETYHREFPRPDPTAGEFRKLLGRFIDVCEAIAFAHSKGVLHRDLKPSNVMLGRFGETLLIDWGLAKATGHREPADSDIAHEATLVPPSGSGHEPTVGAIGSPQFMSPEQAAGDVGSLGPATDVYGLGAILFAVLTGQPPVAGRPTDEVLERVRRGAVRSPRSLNPRIPRALEAVCLKALSLKAQDRYPTALALAEDVEHWLADEPVTAWREPLSARARRWLKRNRTAVAIAIVALAVGVVGLPALAAEQYRHNTLLSEALDDARRARAKADAALAGSKMAEIRTQNALKQSEESRKQAEAVSGFLVDAFRSPDPTQDGRQFKVADFLDRASDQVVKQFADMSATKGALLNALGLTYQGLGLPDRAVKLLEQARSAREAAMGPDHIDTLKSVDCVASIYRETGQIDKAIALHEANLKRCEDKLGSDHLDTLQGRNSLAIDYFYVGRLDEATALFEATLEARESKLEPDHPDMLQNRNNLAIIYATVGRFARAIAPFETTLKLREARQGPDHPDTMISRNNLAEYYCSVGRFSEAIALHEANLKRREDKLAVDHPETLRSRFNLASAYFFAGRLHEAIPMFEETRKRQEAKLGPNHPMTLETRLGLAQAYDAVGRRRDAGGLYRSTLALLRRGAQPNSSFLAIDLALLGQHLLEQSRWSEAEALLREALAIRNQTTPDDWTWYNAMSLLGGALSGQGHYAEAEALIVAGYEGVKAREAKIAVPEKFRVREAAERVVRLYENWGKPAKAEEWKRKLGMPDLPADVFGRR